MLNRNYDPFFLDQNLFIYFSHFYCRLAEGLFFYCRRSVNGGGSFAITLDLQSPNSRLDKINALLEPLTNVSIKIVDRLALDIRVRQLE